MSEKLPILMVAPRKEDFKNNTSGGKTVFFETFTDKLRDDISNQCNILKNEFNIKSSKYKEVPVIGKVIMKDKAIAKSHKPNELFSNNTCPMVGMGKLNEIYIKVTESGLQKLQEEIKITKAKKKMAEMTKIEKIELYSSKDSIKINLSNIQEPLKIKLFDYRNEEENQKNVKSFLEVVHELGLENDIEKLEAYKTMQIYLLKCKDINKIQILSEYQGIKSIDIFQKYSVTNPKLKDIDDMNLKFPKPVEGKEYPIIGLIDSGISEENQIINPWIYKREELVPKEYQNNSHATFIAGVMLFGNSLNFDTDGVQEPGFKILDVAAIPNSDEDFGPTDDISEEVFLEGIETIMKKYSDKVKVWNMSLGTNKKVNEIISDFAIELDRIQDEYGVQIFIAAGNYEDNIREWPVNSEHDDRVTTPADSIRGIVVGSIALDNGSVNKNEPSPFSRKGPGANFINKPDIVDYGGNINTDYSINGCGIVSFDVNGNYIEGIGTSYSTPFATVKYQNVLNNINNPEAMELSKALLIHSCVNPMTKSIEIENEDMKYIGFGIAENKLEEILKCDNSKVTIIIQGKIKTGEHIEIEDIPYPQSLYKNGKWYGSILATLLYNPILDSREGQEYCRSNIDFSMGLHRLNKKTGELEYSGQVPIEKRWDEKYETSRVENGAKWAPIKRHFRKIKNGIVGQDWKIRLDCTNRNNVGSLEQKFILIVTIDSENTETDIYTEMVRGLRNQGFSINNLQLRSDVKIRT